MLDQLRAADLLLMARQRAGLTQGQLARRSGFPRETIARWEGGGREPSFSTIVRVVRAADLDLVPSLVRADDSLYDLTRDQLALTPEARLATFDESGEVPGALWVFARAEIPFVLVGELAAAIQGDAQRPSVRWPMAVSSDADAMGEYLDDHGFHAVDNDDRWRMTDTRLLWRGRSGEELTLANNLPGTNGYSDLRRNADLIEMMGTGILVAHPRDLLRIAEASPRDEDRLRAPGLRALLEVLEEDADG